MNTEYEYVYHFPRKHNVKKFIINYFLILAMKINFICLGKIIETNQTAFDWCLQNGLLSKTRKCPACKSYVKKDIDMQFTTGKDNDFGIFTCYKHKNHRNEKRCHISALKDTCFENAHISIQKALILIYCFVKKLSFQFTIEQTSLSDNTVADWFAYCREVCMEALDREYENQGKIGGIDKIVEIDESKVIARL